VAAGEHPPRYVDALIKVTYEAVMSLVAVSAPGGTNRVRLTKGDRQRTTRLRAVRIW
jgi:hypothetical protein